MKILHLYPLLLFVLFLSSGFGQTKFSSGFLKTSTFSKTKNLNPVTQVRAKSGVVSKNVGFQKYQLFPMAGLPDSDSVLVAYFDHNPAVGAVLDPFGGNRTADGNTGVFAGPLSLPQMEIGVPVFAPLGGTVLIASDGASDSFIADTINPNGNQIYIDHGNDQLTLYRFLKQNSLTVAVGDTVVAGQEIAKVGRSGVAEVPLFSFTTLDTASNVPVPQFAGPSSTNDSLFIDQPDFLPSVYLHDLTVTNISSSSLNSFFNQYPYKPSGKGKFNQRNLVPDEVNFVVDVVNATPNDTYQFRIKTPDGAILGESQPANYPSNIDYHTRHWWGGDILFATLGEWKIEFLLNNQIVAAAPLQVLSDSVAVNTNSPPEVQNVQFASEPLEGRPPVCRIASPTVVDDADYDLVRFRYVWKVNGSTVRDVVSASHSDALADNLISSGDTVVCEVTPNDGEVNGPMSSTSATVLEVNGLVNFASSFGVSLSETSDSDNDDLSLLEEYAYSLDPSLADSQILTSATGVEGLPNMRLVGNRLVIEFIRRTDDPLISYIPEFGDNVNSFSPASGTETVTPIDSSFERVVIQDSQTTATANKRFSRVRVEYN